MNVAADSVTRRSFLGRAGADMSAARNNFQYPLLLLPRDASTLAVCKTLASPARRRRHIQSEASFAARIDPVGVKGVKGRQLSSSSSGATTLTHSFEVLCKNKSWSQVSGAQTPAGGAVELHQVGVRNPMADDREKGFSDVNLGV